MADWNECTRAAAGASAKSWRQWRPQHELKLRLALFPLCGSPPEQASRPDLLTVAEQKERQSTAGADLADRTERASLEQGPLQSAPIRGASFPERGDEDAPSKNSGSPVRVERREERVEGSPVIRRRRDLTYAAEAAGEGARQEGGGVMTESNRRFPPQRT